MRALAVLVLAALLAGCASSAEPRGPDVRAADERPEEDVGGGEGEPGDEGPQAPPPSSGTTSAPTSKGNTAKAPPPTAPPPPPGPASPPRTWASPDSATIRPGASLDSGSCTANFIFTSLDNSTVYIGTAAHCFKTSVDPRSVPGCEAGTEDLGATMDVDGASRPGVLVYSSWIAMQKNGESSADACAYNDFALLRLDPADYASVNPAMKHFGGPTRLVDPTAVQQLDKVLTFGNSGTRVFTDGPTSPKEGYVTFPPGDGWTMRIYTATLGVPGDSGSGVISGDGEALGDLVTLGPTGENGVTVLSKAMAYAAANGFPVRLATWELLDGGLLPA